MIYYNVFLWLCNSYLKFPYYHSFIKIVNYFKLFTKTQKNTSLRSIIVSVIFQLFFSYFKR